MFKLSNNHPGYFSIFPSDFQFALCFFSNFLYCFFLREISLIPKSLLLPEALFLDMTTEALISK